MWELVECLGQEESSTVLSYGYSRRNFWRVLVGLSENSDMLHAHAQPKNSADTTERSLVPHTQPAFVRACVRACVRVLA